jgi:uncharacterized membrane protein YhaH (DUF805 family)
VTFTGAVGTCLRKYVAFSGRARRPEFWWFFLFNVLVSVATSVLDSAMFGHTHVRAGVGFNSDQGPIETVAALLLILPSLSAGARRLHDIGRTGWWLLIMLIPCLGFIVLLVFFCTGGDRHPNRYGEVPT